MSRNNQTGELHKATLRNPLLCTARIRATDRNTHIICAGSYVGYSVYSLARYRQ